MEVPSARDAGSDEAHSAETSAANLREAILTWCDPILVADIKNAERRLTYEDHAEMSLALLAERETLKKPDRFDRTSSGDYAALRGAWDYLVRDLRDRIERRALFVEAVRLAPERGTAVEQINNHWAADMTFDVMRNTLSLGRDRFGSVRISATPIPVRSDSAPTQASSHIASQYGPAESATACKAGSYPPFSLTADGHYVVAPEDVAQLSDDTLLALLEEHARRVVGTPDARLISPGKVSFLPIILRKMMHRAERGELLPKLVDEGEYLAQWIASKVQHHHLPSAGTITKTLSKNYAVLKAQSTAAIQ